VYWPGKVIAVLFINECNIKCRYFSSHGQMGPDQSKVMNINEVVKALIKPSSSGGRLIDFIDGVLQHGHVDIAPGQSLEMVTKDDLLRLAQGVKKTYQARSVVVRTRTHGDEKV
jgi:hypothetical protein